MKLYIPEIGDSIKLTADWTFDLFNEDRNSTLMEHLGDQRKTTGAWNTAFGSIPATIHAGAILKIDRVYIRKGSKDFSSVTFLWKGMALPAKLDENRSWDRTTNTYLPNGTFSKIPRIPIRFWAKLKDVNTIECEQA